MQSPKKNKDSMVCNHIQNFINNLIFLGVQEPPSNWTLISVLKQVIGSDYDLALRKEKWDLWNADLSSAAPLWFDNPQFSLEVNKCSLMMLCQCNTVFRSLQECTSRVQLTTELQQNSYTHLKSLWKEKKMQSNAHTCAPPTPAVQCIKKKKKSDWTFQHKRVCRFVTTPPTCFWSISDHH